MEKFKTLEFKNIDDLNEEAQKLIKDGWKVYIPAHVSFNPPILKEVFYKVE